MTPQSIRTSLQHILPTGGDETVLDYVVGVLEDEDFEWGENGEGAFEAIGDFLVIHSIPSHTSELIRVLQVEGGFVQNAEEAEKACAKVAATISSTSFRDFCPSRGGQSWTVVEGGVDEAGVSRALEKGPMRLSDDPGAVVIDEVSVKHLLENPLGISVPSVREKDRMKLERRHQKEEKQHRAVIAARQAEAEAVMQEAIPTIQRNLAGGVVGNIKLEDFSVNNGGKELIQNGELLLATGRRYGLVGRNGTGKTTLLRALAQKEIKGIPSYCQVVHVEQEARGDENTVLETILQCDTERTALLREEKALQSGDAGGEKSDGLRKVYDRLNEIDAYNAESRAAAILAGLSFTPEMQRKKTRELSGGWRMRAALAQALFIQPDLLLLDEPTNHLDLHAVIWLEDCLQKWPKTLLIVSHARHFLNAVCTDVVHLHSCRLVTYRGDFDTFERTMRERLMNEQKRAEAQEKQRKHVQVRLPGPSPFHTDAMQAFIDKFRFNAKRASLVQSRIKALERMAEVQMIERDPEYLFRFPDPGSISATRMVSFEDVDFNYANGPTLFKKLDFGIDAESRFAIVGSNGIGKSTLLNLISGVLEPVRGHVQRNAKARFATFSQHHVDGLDLALTPLQYLIKEYPSVKEQELRNHLGSFGICGSLALQTMYTLSGGQKSRVALSKVTWCKPNVLLLDEPSNHLDMDAVDALIEGLTMFKGAVLMVSHDQYLIESTVDELWMCENGEVTVFHGTFKEYKDRLKKRHA